MKIKNVSKGFSLFELVVVLGILLLILGIVFSGFTNGLKTFRQERAKAERDSDVKRVLELMAIELSQAGVTPNINLEDLPSSNVKSKSPVTTANVNSGASSVTFGHVTGFYPYRPIILELPEDATNSEKIVIGSLSGNTINLLTGKTVAKTHASGVSTGSPSYPNMFGILNPPPTTGNSKSIAPTTTLAPVRLGFFGDMLGDGTLYYVEYTYDYSIRVLNGVNSGFIGRVRRSITKIDGTITAKATPTTILDNVTDVRFNLVYLPTGLRVPIGVEIEIEAESSAPAVTNTTKSYNQTNAANLFSRVRTRTEVYLRGTGAAANIIAAGGESALREMMPTCNTASASALPPCPSWTSIPWWGIVKDNFAAKKFDNSAAENLP
jgi:type II secretory pathway pseudopilin PulG